MTSGATKALRIASKVHGAARSAVFVAVVCGAVSNSGTAFASCATIGAQGLGGYYFDGGFQIVTSLASVSGYLDYYNPGPVWTGSADWVMETDNTGKQHFAQTGVVHQNGQSTHLLVFWEDCNAASLGGSPCRPPQFQNAVTAGESEFVSVLGSGAGLWKFSCERGLPHGQRCDLSVHPQRHRSVWRDSRLYSQIRGSLGWKPRHGRFKHLGGHPHRAVGRHLK